MIQLGSNFTLFVFLSFDFDFLGTTIKNGAKVLKTSNFYFFIFFTSGGWIFGILKAQLQDPTKFALAYALLKL